MDERPFREIRIQSGMKSFKQAVAAPRQYTADAQVDCLQCSGKLDTRAAFAREQIPDGIRFTGVACPDCGASHTIELLRREEP
jgi:hypothetical protein